MKIMEYIERHYFITPLSKDEDELEGLEAASTDCVSLKRLFTLRYRINRKNIIVKQYTQLALLHQLVSFLCELGPPEPGNSIEKIYKRKVKLQELEANLHSTFVFTSKIKE